MAQPTEEQIKAVRALEAAHKKLFYSLVAATQFWLGLSAKYSVLPVNDPRKIAMLNFGKKISPIMGEWWIQEVQLERDAGIPKMGIKPEDFYDRTKSKYLLDLVAKMNAEQTTKGMGFIPLLIWAVIAIVGMWSTKEIVARVNSTEVQQKALVDSTNNFCQQSGLSSEDCKDIFAKQQETIKSDKENKDEGFFDQIKKLLLWGGVAFVGWKVYESQSKKAA